VENLNIEEIYKMEGVLAVREFDLSGKPLYFKSEQLNSIQADSTARLRGSLFSLLSNIFSIYTMYCGIPFEHVNEMMFRSQDVSMVLISGTKRNVGAFFRTGDVNLE
jgi:roadblock/LC7 domain-containing protein